MNRKFLLVDDDIDDAELFCEAISEVDGVSCDTLQNGNELFSYLAANRSQMPELIFLDINMPVVDGWECLKKLKADPGHSKIPVIMYSTSSARRDVDLAYKLGAEIFLTKPVDFEELVNILKALAVAPAEELQTRLKAFKTLKLKQQ